MNTESFLSHMYGFRVSYALHALARHVDNPPSRDQNEVELLIQELLTWFNTHGETINRRDLLDWVIRFKNTLLYIGYDMTKLWPSVDMLDIRSMPAINTTHAMPPRIVEAYVGMMSELHAATVFDFTSVCQYIGQGNSVLDFGCGSGFYSSVLANFAIVTAVDRPEILKHMEGSTKRKIIDSGGGVFDSTSQAWKDTRYKTIFLSEVLHGSRVAMDLLEHLAGYILPAGWLLVNEVAPNRPRDPLFKLQMLIHTGQRGIYDPRNLNPRGLKWIDKFYFSNYHDIHVFMKV